MTSFIWMSFVVLSLGGAVTWGQTVEDLQQSMEVVARQLMQLQSHVEESKRTSTSSGVKAMRTSISGNRNYLGGSYADRLLCGIHNHADFSHAVGLGEFVAVLNGVEFTTRHNDYKMVMRSTTSGDFDEVEDVPLPDVPPKVLAKATVEEQIDEMREWFRAWAMQDHSVRDYRPYFRPVLCYLEGAWYHTDQSTIDESFESDRHHLDASSWLDLQEKAKFNMETGHKDLLENYAVLPTRITGFGSDGIPVLAQWNYKMLCHPLKDDLPLNRFQVANDLHIRMRRENGMTMRDLKGSRLARFRLNIHDEDEWRMETERYWRLMDQLMSEIPGMDNYQAQLTDDVYGAKALNYDNSKGPLNAGYYHRWIRQSDKDANGVNVNAKTFKDDELYMAMTTQSQVVPSEISVCKRGECNTWSQRWTYAMPFEIIYTTPLTNWNPYNIHMNDEDSAKEDADGNKRNGDDSPSKAYNGTSHKLYYRIPSAFFDDEVARDPADTAADGVYVLDSQGGVRHVRASGHRQMHPNIPGVGILRQRYPIFPITDEGTNTHKELSALKEAFQDPLSFPLVTDDPTGGNPYYDPVALLNVWRNVRQEAIDGIFEAPLILMTSPSADEDPHVHFLKLTPEQVEGCTTDDMPDIVSTMANSHTHTIQLSIERKTFNSGKVGPWVQMRSCDGEKTCADGHSSRFTVV